VFCSRFFAVCAVLAASLFTGCQREDHSPVIATVGPIAISAADFETRLKETPPEFQHYTASPEGRRQFLNLLIREKVVLRIAQRSSIPREDAYRAAVSNYQRQLNQRLQEYKDTLLVNSYLRKLATDTLAVQDSDVRQFYEAHRADFEHPVQIQASHILVASPDKAQEVLGRLNDGESFETVAREESQDPTTAAAGGTLAPFLKGLGVGLPELENAAAALRIGEISKPIQTSFGYHIIKKIAEHRLPARSYDDAKEDIRARLEKQKFDQWVSAKQEALGVHIDERALAAVPAPAAPEEQSKHENH